MWLDVSFVLLLGFLEEASPCRCMDNISDTLATSPKQACKLHCVLARLLLSLGYLGVSRML